MNEKDIKDNILENKGKNLNLPANLAVIPKQNLIKKAEKIGAAVFLVTNFLNDQEPIKWSIRKATLKTISAVAKAFSNDFLIKKNALNESRDSVVELSALIEVSSLSGMISNMNAGVLLKELGDILGVIEREENSGYKPKGSKIPKDFFLIEGGNELSTGEDFNDFQNQISQELSPKNIKDKTIRTHTSAPVSQDGLIKKAREYGSVAIKRNKRQSFIIQVLKKKKDLTIKDISMIFHDCSEKTIQRELASLVNEGVVIKDGERRWTKYSLALAV